MFFMVIPPRSAEMLPEEHQSCRSRTSMGTPGRMRKPSEIMGKSMGNIRFCSQSVLSMSIVFIRLPNWRCPWESFRLAGNFEKGKKNSSKFSARSDFGTIRRLSSSARQCSLCSRGQRGTLLYNYIDISCIIVV